MDAEGPKVLLVRAWVALCETCGATSPPTEHKSFAQSWQKGHREKNCPALVKTKAAGPAAPSGGT